MAVMVTDTSAKYNTIVHDNIWGTKYNTIVVTVLLLCSYPGNGTKYNNILARTWCDSILATCNKCNNILSQF